MWQGGRGLWCRDNRENGWALALWREPRPGETYDQASLIEEGANGLPLLRLQSYGLAAKSRIDFIFQN